MSSRALLASSAIRTWSSVCSFLGDREFRRLKSAGPGLPFSPNLRVALVKQSTYTDLYTAPSAPDALSLVRSSWLRTGPIGLFTEFKSRFIIVYPEPDPECRVWEEKKKYWLGNPKREADDLERHAIQERVAVRAAEVDWSDFDVVIAIENAVPACVTRRYPGVLWASLLEHHRMGVYSRYLQAPPTGYDLFFNLRYGPNPSSWRRRHHVVDWPYNYTRPGVLPKVFGRPTRSTVTNNRPFTVLIEDHQNNSLVEALLGAGIHVIKGRKATLAEYLEAVLDADALVFPAPHRPLGGLAMVDAASADLALVGDQHKLWNPYLVTSEGAAKSTERALAVLRNLANNHAIRDALLAEQRKRLDWFVGVRPWLQIQTALGPIKRTLSIRAAQL